MLPEELKGLAHQLRLLIRQVGLLGSIHLKHLFILVILMEHIFLLGHGLNIKNLLIAQGLEITLTSDVLLELVLVVGFL